MAGFEFMSLPRKSKFRFKIAPAHNALSSLWLLNFERVEYVDWVRKTRAKLSPEQLKTNKEVCWPAANQLRGTTWPSFAAWLDDFSKRDPSEMAHYEISNLLERTHIYTQEHHTVTPEQLLSDQETYLAVVKTLLGFTGWDFDQTKAAEDFSTLTNPTKMAARKEKTIAHLSMMWDEHFATEWERLQPTIQDSLAAFQSIEITGLSDEETISKISGGGEVPEPWQSWLPAVDEVIIFPNPHIAYHSLIIDRTARKAYIAFLAHTPKSATIQLPRLTRSMLKMGLSALADETRLQIIDLLAREGPLNAKEIQTRLNLSQSAASRHINQLAGGGYLKVEKISGVKYLSNSNYPLDQLFEQLKELFG